MNHGGLTLEKHFFSENFTLPRHFLNKKSKWFGLHCCTSCISYIFAPNSTTTVWIWSLHRSEANICTWAHNNTQAMVFCRQGAHNTHAHTCMQRQSRVIHRHSQICVPWHLRVIFFTLCISTSPNFCSGAYAKTKCKYGHHTTRLLYEPRHSRWHAP